jgi:hypothetical protein
MITPTAPRTPAEWLAAIVLRLGLVVDGHSMWGTLARPLALLILTRIRLINQRFRRIADSVREGRYVFRVIAAAPGRGATKPRPPSELPHKFGWLLKLLPEAAGHRAQLEHLFRDAEMVALLEAAPASLGRPLRSLCWMLALPPPKILAPPARPPKPPKPRPAKVAKPPPLPPIGPPPPHPDAPWWLRMPPSRTRWLPSRSRSPKNRA